MEQAVSVSAYLVQNNNRLPPCCTCNTLTVTGFHMAQKCFDQEAGLRLMGLMVTFVVLPLCVSVGMCLRACGYWNTEKPFVISLSKPAASQVQDSPRHRLSFWSVFIQTIYLANTSVIFYTRNNFPVIFSVSYLVTRRAYISEISGGLFLSAKAYKLEVHAEGSMFQAPAIHLEFFWRKNGLAPILTKTIALCFAA
jgi:hypothetical protein